MKPSRCSSRHPSLQMSIIQLWIPKTRVLKVSVLFYRCMSYACSELFLHELGLMDLCADLSKFYLMGSGSWSLTLAEELCCYIFEHKHLTSRYNKFLTLQPIVKDQPSDLLIKFIFVSSAVHRIMLRSVHDLDYDDPKGNDNCRLSIDPEQPSRFQRAVNPQISSEKGNESKTPPQLLYRQTSSWSHVDISLDRLNALDSVVLKYQIPWPLDLIMTPSVMEKYSIIFTSQLRYRLVEWWLRRVWWKLRDTSRTGIKPIRGAASGFDRLRLVHKWYMVRKGFLHEFYKLGAV